MLYLNDTKTAVSDGSTTEPHTESGRLFSCSSLHAPPVTPLLVENLEELLAQPDPTLQEGMRFVSRTMDRVLQGDLDRIPFSRIETILEELHKSTLKRQSPKGQNT